MTAQPVAKFYVIVAGSENLALLGVSKSGFAHNYESKQNFLQMLRLTSDNRVQFTSHCRVRHSFFRAPCLSNVPAEMQFGYCHVDDAVRGRFNHRFVRNSTEGRTVVWI
jgi:hypothetical protein